MNGAALSVRRRVLPVERIAFPAGVAAVGLLAGAVCLRGALRFAFWQDEVASARAVAEPGPVAMLGHVARTESTPPLWYALAWLAHRCGLALVDVRLLSVAAAALLAAGTALAARRVVPSSAALLSGLAVALGYQFDFHGRELRAYELAALLTVALAVAAARGSDRTLALVVAAGSLTHYFFLFSVAVVLVWAPRRGRAVGAGLVPFALWAPMFARQYAQHRFGFIGPFDPRAVLDTYWTMFARAQPQDAVVHVLAPLALLGAVVAGCVVLARSSNEGRLWAMLALGPVVLAAALWIAGVRIYDVRNLIVTGPFAAVAATSLLSHLPRRAGATLACAVAVLVVVGFVRANRVHPVAYDRIAAALVAEGWQPRDPIVVDGNVYALWGPLEWYLPHRPVLVLGSTARAGRVFVVHVGRALVTRLDRTHAWRRVPVLVGT